MNTLKPRPFQPEIKRKKDQLQNMSNINLKTLRIFIFGIILSLLIKAQWVRNV